MSTVGRSRVKKQISNLTSNLAQKKVISEKSDERTKLHSTDLADPSLNDKDLVGHAKQMHLFDGVQVSVNSDEELDYDDDEVLLNDEDDRGSIDEIEHEGEQDKSIITDSDIILGASSANMSMTDEERVMSNPHLKKTIQQNVG